MGKIKDENRERITFYGRKDQREEVRKVAKELGVSMSVIINKGIRGVLDEHNAGLKI